MSVYIAARAPTNKSYYKPYYSTHKGWGSTRMIKEFPSKMWKRRAVDYLVKKLDLDGTTARKSGSGRPKSARTTENVKIVSELICSQEDTRTRRTVT